MTELEVLMGKRFILFMKDRHLGYKNLKIKKISIPKIDKPSSGYHEFLVEILVVGFPTHDYYDETILAFHYLILVPTYTPSFSFYLWLALSWQRNYVY